MKNTIVLIGLVVLLLVGMVMVVISRGDRAPAEPSNQPPDMSGFTPLPPAPDEFQAIEFAAWNTELRNYLPQTGTRQYEQFLDTVLSDQIHVFSCQVSGRTVPGIVLVEEPTDVAVSPPTATARAVEAWRPYIVRDIGSFLFPQTPDVASVVLDDFTPVSEMQGAFATFAPYGQERTVYYGTELSYWYFSESQSCVEEMMHTIYDPSSHVHDE